jgi:hypothetical protein
VMSMIEDQFFLMMRESSIQIISVWLSEKSMSACVNYNYSKVFSDLLCYREVPPIVNNVKHNSSECVMDVKQYHEKNKKCFMDYYLKPVKKIKLRVKILKKTKKEDTEKLIKKVKSGEMQTNYINEELECSLQDGVILHSRIK